MVVIKSRFHHNGRGGEEPAYGLLGGIDVGIHISGCSHHGVAARRHRYTVIEIQVFWLDAAQVKADAVAVPKLFLAEIINRDFLVFCLHLRTVDVVSSITANRYGHLLHQRVVDNGVVLVNNGQVHNAGVGKTLEIRIDKFDRITEKDRRDGVVAPIERLDNQTVDTFYIVGNEAFRPQLRHFASRIGDIDA